MPDPADASPDTCAAEIEGADQYFTAACAVNGYSMMSSAQSCINTANATVSAPIDAQVTDIARNWNPPATFTGGQIRSIVAGAYSLLDQAAAALNQAASKSGIASESLNQIQGELRIVAAHRAQADAYLQAAEQSDANNQAPVSAPNIKGWILNAMNEASNAMVLAYTEGCIMPWWASAWGYTYGALGALAAIVKSTVGIAVAAGQTVVHAAEGALTAIGFGAKLLSIATKWWPIGLLMAAGVSYAVYRKKAYGRVLPEGFHRTVYAKLAKRREPAPAIAGRRYS